MKHIVVLIALLGLVTADVNKQSLLVSPGPVDSSVYLMPLVFNGTMEGPAGPGSTYWNVAQWANPSPITPASVTPGRGPCQMSQPVEWYIANGNARLCMSSTQPKVVELAQSGGSNLPCGQEYDFFLGPTGSITPQYPQNFISINSELPISSFVFLNFSFGAELSYAAASVRCGRSPQCGVSGSIDFVYATAALTLDNLQSKQSLFYQIALYDSREDTCGPEYCSSGPHEWFFSTNPFGLNDPVGAYGYPCLQPGEGRVYYDLDVLPKLLNGLASGAPAGMDIDPSHWKLSGLYIGTGMQGNAVSTIFLDSIELVAHW